MIFLLFIRTLRTLKAQQIFYRLYYPIKTFFYFEKKITSSSFIAALNFPSINWVQLPLLEPIYDPQTNSFNLLNQKVTFNKSINWNYKENGLLWAFHLNYFQWLKDESLSFEDRLKTINNYISNTNKQHVGKAIYPTSIRIHEWIFFITKNNIQDKKVIEFLYQDAARIYHFPEYEIGANHLFENGMALYLSALYFNQKDFHKKAKTILLNAFKNQILNDGGHYEQSPSYHALLLRRLLFCYELNVKTKRFLDGGFSELLKNTISKMLGWLQNISYKDGNIAHLNDVAPEPHYSTNELNKYALELGITPTALVLKGSGYRKWEGENWEMIIDIGSIACRFQPGHSHSDSLNFCLKVGTSELIVDTGTSTYENGTIRSCERSSKAHNILRFEGLNQNENWAAFRVARKSKTNILKEDNDYIIAENEDYTKFKNRIQRSFQKIENQITLIDTVFNLKNQTVLLTLHLHPQVNLTKMGKNTFRLNNTKMEFEGALDIEIGKYNYANNFNNTNLAQFLQLKIKSPILKTIIDIDFYSCS